VAGMIAPDRYSMLATSCASIDLKTRGSTMGRMT